MVHDNPVALDEKAGVFRVDRKFLTGMQRYSEMINEPLVSVHPELLPDDRTMDLVEVKPKDLGFRVLTISRNGASTVDLQRVEQQIAGSRLIYGSPNHGCVGIARRLGIPYVLAIEYDFLTQVAATTSQVSGTGRRLARTLKQAYRYLFEFVPVLQGAAALHCNGYPMYDESRFFNKNRLLYLDSRMNADVIISDHELESRLSQLNKRPLKLLFSGRFDRVKGADDCIRVALECLRRGLNIELHCYGQGDLRDEMGRIAAQAPVPDRIFIHPAIPFPELILRSREFDLFVCCHIQSDPSCTYLESFGAGLPIVGYGNRMWRRLSSVSGGGIATRMGRPEQVVDSIAQLIKNQYLLCQLSRKARSFAVDHSFEREFSLRTDAIARILNSVPSSGH